jgi:hypothetical protein
VYLFLPACTTHRATRSWRMEGVESGAGTSRQSGTPSPTLMSQMSQDSAKSGGIYQMRRPLRNT